MPEPEDEPTYPDPREEDIMAGDRRLSRPDSSLPDWEMPDTAYRPVPIVWFTGAFFMHLIAIMAVFVTFAVIGIMLPWLILGGCALAALQIGKWTWDRGMHSAGFGWKIATIAMLVFNLLFVFAAFYAA
ncbi:MAG: hypothetical protein AAFR64_06665 [Pseudomonadota bacterium]